MADPHPSPLPEGEGADRTILKSYADLKVLYRIHNRLNASGRRNSNEQRAQSPHPTQGEAANRGVISFPPT